MSTRAKVGALLAWLLVFLSVFFWQTEKTYGDTPGCVTWSEWNKVNIDDSKSFIRTTFGTSGETGAIGSSGEIYGLLGGIGVNNADRIHVRNELVKIYPACTDAKWAGGYVMVVFDKRNNRMVIGMMTTYEGGLSFRTAA